MAVAYLPYQTRTIMDEENNGVIDTSNQSETVELDTTNDEGYYEEEAEDVEAIKARAAKAEELAKNYKIRAEKAERLAKEKSEATPKASPAAGDISSKDLYALMESKVPQEDIDDVREYAQLKKISIAEALKAPLVKSLLSDKAEQRNVASAANVGNSKRSSAKLSDESLIENVKKGVLPENDEDIMRYVQARNKR